MSHHIRVFDKPERFVAGTVGPPGERTFFLQARGDGQLVSVVLEKVQVALLADKLAELLDEARRRFDAVVPTPTQPSDNEPLDSPLEEEFRVAALGLAWDSDSKTVIVEAIAAGPHTDEDLRDAVDESNVFANEDLDRLRVRLTVDQTVAFIERARRVITAGRPPCPFCGQPLDPDGHLCPRHNGFRGR